MSVALPIDWSVVQTHLIATGGDFTATAQAFDIKEKTLRKRSERGQWMSQFRAYDKKRAEIASQSVAKLTESLAELGESVKFTGMKLAKQGLERFYEQAPTPENWQEAKLAIDIAGKIGNWSAPQTAVQVNVWGGGVTTGESPRVIDLESEEAVNTSS